MQQNVLYHSGVKGMRWGHRKSADITTTRKSKHRLNLEEKYKAGGMNDKDAENAASNRIKVEKIVGITAGMTVAAVSAYVISKNVKERADGIIKAGVDIQHITTFPERDLKGGRPLYVSYLDNDKLKYKGKYANGLNSSTITKNSKVYNLNFVSDKDVKIASHENARKVLNHLIKTDKEFQSLNGSDKKVSRYQYESFNKRLGDMIASTDDRQKNKAFKYIDALKKSGYQGIYDVYDQKYSSYNAKKPTILFDIDKTVRKTITEITPDVLSKDYQEATRLMASEEIKNGILSKLQNRR